MIRSDPRIASYHAVPPLFSFSDDPSVTLSVVPLELVPCVILVPFDNSLSY